MATPQPPTDATSLSSRGPVAPIRRGPTEVSPPPLDWTYKYILTALLGFMTADLSLLFFRDTFLPQGVPDFPRPARVVPYVSQNAYKDIVDRNIFNSDGVIPDPIRPAGANPNNPSQPQDGPAIPTTLSQLSLVGTLVHVNPARSVATIELKGGTAKVLPYFPNDEIEGLAQLVKVERKKAIFRNHSSGRLEYIEIKDDVGVTFGRTKNEKPGEIVQQGNEFTLKRADVNEYLKNLDQILQQATAVPNIAPGTGGQIDGFRLIDIAPGSLYEKIGLKKGDVIKGVNGEKVDSPNKALELYQQLKNSGRISLDLERNGQSENLNFNILQ